jgi:hypothetical protein
MSEITLQSQTPIEGGQIIKMRTGINGDLEITCLPDGDKMKFDYEKEHIIVTIPKNKRQALAAFILAA